MAPPAVAAALIGSNGRLQGISDSLAVLFGGQGRKGKEGGADGVAGELAALGLRVKEVPSDGNCFFYALCDQLEVRNATGHGALVPVVC